MANFKNTNINLSGSDVGRGIVLPIGDDNDRTNVAGDIRFNTDRGYVEYNTAGHWVDARNKWGGPVTNGLQSNWDATDPASAPTGSNGTTWVDLSTHPQKLGNININGSVSDWSYSSLGGVPTVRNTTVRDGGGMPVDITNFNKLHGTWEFWCRSESWSGSYSQGLFVNRTASTANDTDWFWVGMWNNGTNNYFRTGTTSGCCAMDLNSGSAVPPVNAWNQIVYVWDLRGSNVGQGSGYKATWLNGVRIEERTVSETTRAGNVENTGKIGLGHNSVSGAQFYGGISIVRLYDRALTDEDVRQNYNAGLLKFNT